MLSGGAMRAILVREPGDERVLVVGDAPRPPLGAADVRIRVRTAGVNRADLLQRQGLYPPPPGASPILGLECARELTGGRGVDVVLDHIGARYLAANLAALAPGGRLVEIGLMGGAVAELNLAQLLLRRLAVIGSTLRSRSNEDKAAIVEGFRARFGTALARGALRPVVDRVLPLEQAAEAHRLMQASEHFGKIVLRVA